MSKSSQPNLYLVGFMGVGKSVIGRALAKKLHMGFLDSDREIEERAGRSIKEIFATDGEPAFRLLEREFVESGHPERGFVVACGGGLIIAPGILEILENRGVVVCLHASVETILKRTMNNDKRPLLNVEDPHHRIRKLMSERDPIYKKVRLGLCTENQSIRELVRRLESLYLREVRDRTRAAKPAALKS